MATKCAVFASGGGSNFQALLDKRASGDLHVDFAVLITNNGTATACDRARAHDIPVVVLPPSRFADPNDYTTHLQKVLTDSEADLIILAGYMKMIPVEVVSRFRNRIVNIHPALLPAFGGKGMYGSRVHEAVLAYGAKVSGITVHFVDEHYDHGPVIMQRTVDVLDSDTPETLAKRVLEVEHDSYWQAIEAIAHDRVRVEGRKVSGSV